MGLASGPVARAGRGQNDETSRAGSNAPGHRPAIDDQQAQDEQRGSATRAAPPGPRPRLYCKYASSA